METIKDDRERLEFHLEAIRKEVDAALQDMPGVINEAKATEVEIYLEDFINSLYDLNERQIEERDADIAYCNNLSRNGVR